MEKECPIDVKPKRVHDNTKAHYYSEKGKRRFTRKGGITSTVQRIASSIRRVKWRQKELETWKVLAQSRLYITFWLASKNLQET